MNYPCLQTVSILHDNAPFTVESLDIAPAQPGNTFCMKVKDDIYFWYNDRTEKLTRDGTRHRWYKKPDIGYVLSKEADGSYFQFNKDGSVYAREGTYYYYWSKQLDPSRAVILNGTRLPDTYDDYQLTYAYSNTSLTFEEFMREEAILEENEEYADYDEFNRELCAICGSPSTSQCPRCMSVHYCCPAHQKNHWKSHKNECRERKERIYEYESGYDSD